VFRAEARFSEHNFCLVVCSGDIYTWLLFIFSMSHASVSNFDICIFFKPTIPFHHIYKLQEACSSSYQPQNPKICASDTPGGENWKDPGLTQYSCWNNVHGLLISSVHIFLQFII
jgi:hypothetical protein